MIPAKDGLLIKDISVSKFSVCIMTITTTISQQSDYDHLTVNLRIETNYVKESMQINWKAQVSSYVYTRRVPLFAAVEWHCR